MVSIIRRISSPPSLVRIAVVVVIILVLAAGVEGVSRLVFSFKDEIKQTLKVDQAPGEGYLVRDSNHYGLVRLKPGFVLTVEDLLGPTGYEGENQILIQINQDGYRGPELDPIRSRSRVLNLGDSITFGNTSPTTYPRVLERELRLSGVNIEPINAGVPGYSTTEVLLRIDEFRALTPDVTTVFIGWNDLYSDPKLARSGWEGRLSTVRLYKRLSERIRNITPGLSDGNRSPYNKPNLPSRDSSDVLALKEYLPSSMTDLYRIVDQMEASGTKVILVTLPSLFVMYEEPSQIALQIGHLPAYTENPFVLAQITARYNHLVRELAGRRGLKVIDLEDWSRTNLQPRSDYFIDSIHLNENGLESIGTYMAEELLEFF